MLVLSRQRDQTIMIGDDIEITVVDVRGDKVRLGITAPSTVAVHRKEVYEAIRAENAPASRPKGKAGKVAGTFNPEGNPETANKPPVAANPKRAKGNSGRHDDAQPPRPQPVIR